MLKLFARRLASALRMLASMSALAQNPFAVQNVAYVEVHGEVALSSLRNRELIMNLRVLQRIVATSSTALQISLPKWLMDTLLSCRTPTVTLYSV